MPVIQIPFSHSLANVSLSRGDAIRNATGGEPVATPPGNAQTEPVPDSEQSLATDALRTLDSIAQQIRDLDAKLECELASVGVQLVAAATQIAREALGSDNALLEERVAHFAETLLRQIRPDQSATFFVNPSCMASLQAWMSASDHPPITILPDATVPPGDCRIETNDKGFLASLESFLDAAAKQTALAKGGE